MARRIYIINKGAEITQKILDAAKAANCPEIITGIPPALKDIMKGKKLPYIYEEPELPSPEPERNLAAEIDALKAEVEALKKP